MLSSSFSFFLISETTGDDSLGGIGGGGNSRGARDGGGTGTDGGATLALLSPETWDGAEDGKGQQGQGSPGRRLPFRPCSQQCWSC